MHKKLKARSVGPFFMAFNLLVLQASQNLKKKLPHDANEDVSRSRQEDHSLGYRKGYRSLRALRSRL